MREAVSLYVEDVIEAGEEVPGGGVPLEVVSSPYTGTTKTDTLSICS